MELTPAWIICSRKSGPVSMTTVVMPPSGAICSTRKAARVRRFLAFLGSQAPQSPVMRGTPGDEEQPSMVKRRRCVTPSDLCHLGEAAEGVRRSDFGDLAHADADRIGQHFGGIDDVGWLVAFAAPALRRQIRRVGFDQQPIMRDRLGDVAQFLRLREGQDAGKGNIAAQFHACAGKGRAGGEAMEDEGESPLPCFFGQNRGHVLVGAAAMDDQRQLRFARGRNMAQEACLLVRWIDGIVEVIETRLADCDDFLVLICQPHEILGLDVQLLIGAVRMRTDRAENRRIALGKRKQSIELPDLGRDSDHLLDADVVGARDDRVALLLEIGKIQMAVRVHQHGKPYSAVGAT
ncbi:hypothetical protein RHSP_04597 [Rhizobium freirei PRF 81]|uniref:Uncharacterized protein n=1 Tax=Rhizobium freirei PRF 81 TaxID=363754 RepID=N6UAA2_9HYPH|nr:hypothetical protein RHSP_04597 [Rhizobium freirei PRF 81]